MSNPPPRGAARPEVFSASAMPWHALAAEEVAELLGTDPESGLARVAADHRRALVGANRVGEARETPVWRLALDQFRSLVVLLLLAAASIAALLGERAEALAILAAELGRIGQLVALAGERTTPLEQQVEELGRRLPNPTS